MVASAAWSRDVRFYRVTLRTHSHSPTFVLASDGTRVWRLGGTESPELVDFVNEVASRWNAPDAVPAFVQAVASLADPLGGRMMVAPGRSRDRPNWPAGAIEAVGQWAKLRGAEWPIDTTIILDSREILVRETYLSGAPSPNGTFWVASSLTFLFSPDRRLIAWNRRDADPFVISTESRP